VQTAGKTARKPERKAGMQARVAAGVLVGVLAYVEGAPVGWCAIAPRESYRTLGGDEAKSSVW
jgi:hypothetical protein